MEVVLKLIKILPLLKFKTIKSQENSCIGTRYFSLAYTEYFLSVSDLEVTKAQPSKGMKLSSVFDYN